MSDVSAVEQSAPVVPLFTSTYPIESERLVLRPMRVADIDTVVEYRSRPDVYAFLSHGGAAREKLSEKLQRRIERMREPSDDAAEVQLVIERCDLERDAESRHERGRRMSSHRDPVGRAAASHDSDAGGNVIGDCGFRITRVWTKDDAPTRHLVARIHYALDNAVAGRGYGTETVHALVSHLFAHPDVHRIQADVFAENGASRRVLEKCGFRQEGYFVDDGLIDGRFVDATIYSLLRRDWETAGRD